MKLIVSVAILTVGVGAHAAGESPSGTAALSNSPAHLSKPQSDVKTSLPKDGLVPDKETAVKIAEAVLFRLYGQDAITAQRPYTIKEEDFIWWITGNIPEGTLGFTFKIAVSKQTGAILHLSVY